MKGGIKGKKKLSRYLERKEATWPQVLSGSPQWYSAPFEEYDVHYLPLHLLLNSEGLIVKVNPRGDQLDTAIDEALAAEGR